jgi:hypothetical protein
VKKNSPVKWKRLNRGNFAFLRPLMKPAVARQPKAVFHGVKITLGKPEARQKGTNHAQRVMKERINLANKEVSYGNTIKRSICI